MRIAWLELKRRLARMRGDERLIWGAEPAGLALSPSEFDLAEYERVQPRLAWRDGADAVDWQRTARDKLAELLGIAATPRSVPAAVHETSPAGVPPGADARTVYLEVAPLRHVPVTVVWRPGAAETPRPVMLCLQGHTSGAHVSWGMARLPIDVRRIERGGDYARQALRHGYVAVCVEQACFGERRETRLARRSAHSCLDAVNRALLLGRTVLGGRVSDLRAVVDWLEAGETPGPPIDRDRIYAMGNSAGGETALFSVAIDKRIGALIAGGCVAPYRAPDARARTCPDSAIPGILRWLEYQDVVALCAPRPALIVSGTRDHLYPYHLAEACVRGARPVYAAFGAAERLRVVAGEGGHRFYPEVAWQAFRELVGCQ